MPTSEQKTAPLKPSLFAHAKRKVSTSTSASTLTSHSDNVTPIATCTSTSHASISSTSSSSSSKQHLTTKSSSAPRPEEPATTSSEDKLVESYSRLRESQAIYHGLSNVLKWQMKVEEELGGKKRKRVGTFDWEAEERLAALTALVGWKGKQLEEARRETERLESKIGGDVGRVE